jgi:3-dehydroquinate synthase
MHRSIDVDLGGRSYPIVVGRGTWEAMAECLEAGRPGRTVLVTDERVGSLYGERVRAILNRADLDHISITVPQGEKSKSFHYLEHLCREMALSGVGRDGMVIALGGGVVGDLAGLASSTYLRGIRLVQLPTTLLAMVDSSVGGKTGINIPEGKNLVGTFYQPEGVYAEVGVLGTLDERDWYSGLAEAVKIAITMDAELFSCLESAQDVGPSGDLDISRVILAACMKKADVVRRDERESDLRRVLNFGHTLGHAIEAALGYGTVRHGEAVVMGMQGALRLSVDLCGLALDRYHRAMGVLGKIPIPEIDAAGETFEKFMRRDKKATGTAVHAVLISDIGHYEFIDLEDPGVLVEAFLKVTGVGK